MALSRINSSMIGAGDVSNDEHSYLNSVTSNVQTQIDGVGGGKVLQVVSNFGGATASSTTLHTWHTAGSAINITPASASNYILLYASSNGYFNGGSGFPQIQMSIRRTLGGTTTNDVAEKQEGYLDARSSGTLFGQQQFPMTVLGKDIPSTTSQLTYQVEYKATGASWTGTGGLFGSVNIMAMEIDAT